eukprot:5742936-Prymnesium_polylepis.3
MRRTLRRRAHPCVGVLALCRIAARQQRVHQKPAARPREQSLGNRVDPRKSLPRAVAAPEIIGADQKDRDEPWVGGHRGAQLAVCESPQKMLRVVRRDTEHNGPGPPLAECLREDVRHAATAAH